MNQSNSSTDNSFPDNNNLMSFRCRSDLLKDRCVLVTGAGDGIGKAVAILCAKLGAQVLLLGRTEKKLNRVYDEIEGFSPGTATIIPFDLNEKEEDQYQQIGNFVKENFRQLDGLIHCASLLGTLQPLAQTKGESFVEIIQTNLNSHFLLTKALLEPLSESNNASVVITSSSVGRTPRAYWGAYSISKVAVEAMSSIWADELGDAEKIRFNTLNPGATNTAMRRKAYPTEPVDKNPDPSEIAWAYIYLLSEESKSVNGQQLDAQQKK